MFVICQRICNFPNFAKFFISCDHCLSKEGVHKHENDVFSDNNDGNVIYEHGKNDGNAQVAPYVALPTATMVAEMGGNLGASLGEDGWAFLVAII